MGNLKSYAGALFWAALLLPAACGTENETAEGQTQYTVWCDPSTDLCWQNPQKDAYDAADTGVVPSEAEAYCENLVLDGYGDWRLPTIEELRTIVAGSVETESGGSCGVLAGAGAGDGQTPACLGGQPFVGPGTDGCYWKEGLAGTCDKPDPAVVGHPLETWAINPAVDDPAHWVAYVTFDTGAVGFNHTCSLGDVRCVRNIDGAQPPACEVNGTPCTDFFSSKEHCDQDLTGEADTLALTVRVPYALQEQPHQLMAFFYKAGDDWYPPLGPPDGGTDLNQVIDPVIAVDEPLTLILPGTTYYREELLDGDYQIYVHLQMEEKFPPIPVNDDFVWGEGRAVVSFPFNGDEHQGTETGMEITLEPVGCPIDTPHRCPNDTCVADPGQCVATECPGVPDDSQVLTCRYASLFIEDNCADFPIVDGWTVPEVEDFCRGQMGANASTLVVTQGDSCLVDRGGFDSASRCAADHEGKRWWAYGAPEFVCSLFLNGAHQPGAFCLEY